MYYTINLGSNRAVGYIDRKRSYIVGFRSAMMARKVMYEIHPKPEMILVRNEKRSVTGPGGDVLLTMESGTLFIPKSLDSVYHHLSETGFYMERHEEDAFLSLPDTKKVGLILPYRILEETDEEFIFRANVVNPIP